MERRARSGAGRREGLVADIKPSTPDITSSAIKASVMIVAAKAPALAITAPIVVAGTNSAAPGVSATAPSGGVDSVRGLRQGDSAPTADVRGSPLRRVELPLLSAPTGADFAAVGIASDAEPAGSTTGGRTGVSARLGRGVSVPGSGEAAGGLDRGEGEGADASSGKGLQADGRRRVSGTDGGGNGPGRMWLDGDKEEDEEKEVDILSMDDPAGDVPPASNQLSGNRPAASNVTTSGAAASKQHAGSHAATSNALAKNDVTASDKLGGHAALAKGAAGSAAAAGESTGNATAGVPTGIVSVKDEPAGNVNRDGMSTGNVAVVGPAASRVTTDERAAGIFTNGEGPAGNTTADKSTCDVTTGAFSGNATTTGQPVATLAAGGPFSDGGVTAGGEPAGNVAAVGDAAGNAASGKYPAGDAMATGEPARGSLGGQRSAPREGASPRLVGELAKTRANGDEGMGSANGEGLMGTNEGACWVSGAVPLVTAASPNVGETCAGVVPSTGCAVKKEESECGQGSKRGLSKKSSFQGTRQVSKESADGGMSSADAMDVDVSWQGSPVDELAPVNVLASATHTSPPPGSGGRVAAPGGGAACAPAAAISTGAGGDGPWGTPALVADVPLSGAISSTSGGSSVAGKAGSRGLVVTNGSGSPAGGGGVAGGISAAVKKEQLPVPAEGSQGNMVLVDEDAIGDDASGAEAGGQATRGSLGSQGSLSGHQVSQRSAPGKGPHGGVASRSPPKDGPSGAVGHPGSPRRDTDAVVPRSDVPSQSSAVPSSSIAPQEALPSGRAGDAASSRDQPMDRLGPGPDARSTDRDGRPAGAGHSSSPERGASGSAAIDSLGVKGGPSGTDGRVSVSAVDMKAMREGPGSSFPGRLSQEGKATSPTLRDAAAPGASLGHAEGGLERQAPGAYVTEACNDNGHVEAGCSTLSPASGDVQMVRADDGGGGSGAGGGGGSIGGSGSGGAGGSVDGALGGSGAGGGEGDDSIPVKWTLEEVRIYRKARLLFPNDARGVLTARLLGTKSPQAVRAFREADERRRGEEGSAGGGKQANGIALDGADGGGKGRAGASGGGNDKRGRLGGKGRADGTGNDKLGGGLLGMLSNETGSPEDSKAANEDETAVAATRQRRRRRKGMVTKNRRKQGPYRLATNMLRRVMQNHMDCNKGATARQRSRFMSRGLPSKEGGPTADGGAGNADEGGEAATNPLMLYPKQTYTPCSHAGNKVVTTCNSDAPCSCVRNGTFCEKWCDCPETCNIRFSGCGCRPGQCRGSSCVCRAMHRECDPDLCTGCTGENPDLSDSACQNQAVMRKEHRRLLLGVSDVAGWGVFLRDGAEPDDFICEYVGELVTQKEAQKRGLIYDRQNVSFLFELNSNVCVDATRCGNKSKFANHSNEPNCYMQVQPQ
eukprot:jgi/Mesvir1/27422/Mv07215-RA.4